MLTKPMNEWGFISQDIFVGIGKLQVAFNDEIDRIRENAIQRLRTRLSDHFYFLYTQRYGPDEGDDADYQHNVVDASNEPLQWFPDWDDYILNRDNAGLQEFTQLLNDEIPAMFNRVTSELGAE